MKILQAVLLLLTFSVLSSCGGGGGGGYVPDCLFFCDIPPTKISVSAGPDQTAIEGDTVVISGVVDQTQCFADTTWTQVSGPTVSIRRFFDGTENHSVTIDAPSPDQGASATFNFQGECRNGLSSADQMEVTFESARAHSRCDSAPLFMTTYLWRDHGCTVDSAAIEDDSRVATIFRQGESEGNDSPQQATPLTFPARVLDESIGVAVAGSIDNSLASGSKDYFIFSPPESGLYQIYFCNDPYICFRGTISRHWMLTLYGQDLSPISSTSNAEIAEFRLDVQLAAGLPYYLELRAFDDIPPERQYNISILQPSD